MPFKSKAQQRFMFASEAEGELPKGTAKRWANETEKKKGGIEALPEKVKPSKKTAGEMAKVALTRWQKELDKGNDFLAGTNPSPSNYLNLGTNGGKQTLKRPAWLTSDVPVPAELENALKDFRASKAAPAAAAPAAAAAAEAVPQAASQAVSKAVPQAASKINPRLLRNLGIGGAALGAAGLGGYGLYRAFRKDGGGSKKEGSIQKSFFKFSAGEAAAVTPWQQGFMDASAKLAPPGMLNASADVAQAHLQRLQGMGGVSADAFSNLPTIGGNADIPIIGDYSKADVPILRGPERPANPTSKVTTTVPRAIPKAAPAVAEAATTGAEAAAKAAPAVSKLNPKLLRNLGIGGAAVGALGLGGYGLYQAAKGNKKPEEQPLKKSAGDSDRWDPRFIGFMSSIPRVGVAAGPVTAAIGAPQGKKTRAGFNTLVGTAAGALGGNTLGTGLGMLGDVFTRNRLGHGRLAEALGLLGSIVGAGGGGALGYNYATHTTKKALPKEAAYVSKESQADMRKSAVEIAEKVCTPEEKAKCCEGESSKKDEKKSEGNPFAKKDEGNPFEKKEAAACSSSSPKPKKMKKSPKEIANKVWSSKKK